MNNIYVGIQARLNSSRLPLKCLLPSVQKKRSILDNIYLNAKQYFSNVYVLVPDDEIAIFQKVFKYTDSLIHGHRSNLLSRYQDFINKVNIGNNDYILRCTADNPMFSFGDVFSLLNNIDLSKDCYTTRTIDMHNIDSSIYKGRNFDLFKANLLSNIIDNSEYESEHVIPYIARVSKSKEILNYNDNKFYSSIDTFNDYINYINMFGDI